MNLRIHIHKCTDGAGNAAQGRCKDDGHNTGHIHLNGNIAVLSAVHLAAHNLLGILHGNAALCIGGNHHEHNGHDCQHSDQGQNEIVLGLTVLCAGQNAHYRIVNAIPAGYDTGKDQQRKAVSDALGIDLFAQPDNQLSTCHKAGNDHQRSQPLACTLGILQHTGTAQHKVVADGHDQCDHRTGHFADDADFAAAFLTLAGKVFQIRNGHAQKLNDDRCIDVGGDAQCEQSTLGQSTAGHHVQISQHGTGLKHSCQSTGFDKGHGDRTAQTEDHNDSQRKQQALAQIFDLPGITKGFEHLRSPRPSRLPSRSFPWQRQYKQLP